VLCIDPHKFRALELVSRVLDVDADQRLDRRLALERLGEPPTDV
jgi:hypothetical protein